MADRKYYENDNRYERDRDGLGLLETIKRDVKAWFDDDDDDDYRKDVKDYDLRDRSGRRYRPDIDRPRTSSARRSSQYERDSIPDLDDERSDYRYGRTRFPQETQRYRSAQRHDMDYGYDFGDNSDARFGADYESDRDQREYGRYGRGERDYSDSSGHRASESSYDDYRAGSGMPFQRTYVEAWFIPGPHSGIGPKGYQRSTDNLKEQVCERLEAHGRIDASEIEVSIDDACEVTLRGTVENRQAKKQAEACAESVRGVSDVHNQIRIARGQRDSGAKGTGTGRATGTNTTRTTTGRKKPESANGNKHS